MFPSSPDPSRPAVRSLRSTIRNAADLAIAFMTLEGYGLDDLRPARPERPLGHPGTADDAAAVSSSSSRAAAGRELRLAPGQPLGLAPVLDLAQPSVPRHPHRRRLHSALTARRPGGVPAREQHCLTPLARPVAPADPASPPPRRRTAAQDASH